MLFWIECLECGEVYEHSINTVIFCARCGSHDFHICEYNQT
jgi:Zn finger protein HypA/HybF involved in hydrogenase expression